MKFNPRLNDSHTLSCPVALFAASALSTLYASGFSRKGSFSLGAGFKKRYFENIQPTPKRLKIRISIKPQKTGFK
ncbi:MAG: hypothetical protein DYG98_15655 [Haliscomenobacteraceae bacterium CHB4]|nr:hypothetical protein [Saprospiraceae bacterium]MCE7924481.1 hypothetical protein [Haliscomenobacteraceae bacterium CHB4]